MFLPQIPVITKVKSSSAHQTNEPTWLQKFLIWFGNTLINFLGIISTAVLILSWGWKSGNESNLMLSLLIVGILGVGIFFVVTARYFKRLVVKIIKFLDNFS
jgi:hypothetical protein